MKLKILLIVGAAVAAGAAGCGGSDHTTATTPPPVSPSGRGLVTSQVLSQAQQPSETAEPYPVNDGAITLIDTNETSEPVSVNGS
jgi:hypothetical protein